MTDSIQPTNLEAFFSKGHKLITDAMAKARAAELLASKNQGVTAAVEQCLRDLWNLMSLGPDASAQQEADAREKAEKDTLAAAEAAVTAETTPDTVVTPDTVPPAGPAPVPGNFTPPAP